ncbi:MAG: hypothetical protein HXX19_05610 [Rhodoferax sp.]|nr:hypothetical protein [Rhodoferax sp.]
MANEKAAEVTRRLKQVAEQQFLRIMEEADRVDPDRTQGTTTAYRKVALSSALDAAIAALNPSDPPQKSSVTVRDSAPTSYRLMRKLSGELVLQGGFLWHDEATEKAGFEWRDIRTEVERESGSKLVFIAPDGVAGGEGI